MAIERQGQRGRGTARLRPIAALVLCICLATLVLLSPSESRLGNLVKLVYVHGALVWVGLGTLTVAAVLGLIALAVRRTFWFRGTRAVLQSAAIVWIVYTLSAILVTGLAWGQWVAWNEPRVRVTALILLGALVVVLADRLIESREFTAISSLALGVAAWIAVRQAEVIRHPVDPIGGSGSTSIKGFYLGIVSAVAGLAVLLVGTLWARHESRARVRSGHVPPTGGTEAEGLERRAR